MKIKKGDKVQVITGAYKGTIAEVTKVLPKESKVCLLYTSFAAGEVVDVIGTSKGHGFTGAVKRHNQKIGPKTHGSGHHRGMGSAATTGLGTNKIDPGFTMPGHYGTDRTTNQNLEIIKVDAEKNYILIKGNVPGPKKGLVIIQSAKCSKGDKTAKVLVDYTKTEEE